MNSLESRAAMFKALGDKTRIQILEFLRERCCPVALEEEGAVHRLDGPTVGEVCCHLTGREKINSTISFHINEMKEAGLISVERRGKYMLCSINQPTLLSLSEYLSDAPAKTDECC